jgi:hypothetical protein
MTENKSKRDEQRQKSNLAYIAKKGCSKCYGRGYTAYQNGSPVPCSCAIANYEKLKRAQLAGAINRLEKGHDSFWCRLRDAAKVLFGKAAAVSFRKRVRA